MDILKSPWGPKKVHKRVGDAFPVHIGQLDHYE